jgi:hypothetical protein
MPVQPWVKKLTESVLPAPKYGVGSMVVIKGRRAKITDGQYWGEHGVSNFWH